ncbi:hypothetical protein [Chondromyces apiculatus]|uniref:Uncharacterized protein n=1 Tax=Chondromyces apiculatus DSM 436 TaxID=1192034 RepID=A0A017T5P2_9BACT|nr:hypothetical protein [Chondromyces apiculatus]EYF04110.1 Hypothetical protein CAP_4793 [Chondromyces apiculatus DSM 436]
MLRPPFGFAPSRALLLLTLVCATASGCALVLGLDDYDDQAPGEGGGGTGGAGGGEPVSCTPGVEEACYAGPEGTQDVGLCKGGTHVCNESGDAWGSCEGEVLPAVELCAESEDENCDTRECIVWATAFAQEGRFEVYGITSDRDGHILVTGMFDGTITVGAQTFSAAGATDGMLIKLEPTGEVMWAKKIGDVDQDFLAAVATDEGGNIYIGGRTLTGINLGDGTIAPGVYAAKLDPEGGYLWSTSLGGNGGFADIAIDSIGNVVAVGFFSGLLNWGEGPVPAAGGKDILVAKFDSETGSLAGTDGGWVRTVGDAEDQVANAVALDASDNVFVVGDFKGQIDIGGSDGQATAFGTDEYDGFLAKFTPGGNGSWLFGVMGNLEQHVYDVAVDSQGQPFIVGEYEGMVETDPYVLISQGGKDAFLMHVGASGNVLWVDSFGESGDQLARTVALDGEGNILLGGYAEEAIDLGGGPLTVAGVIGSYVAKLAPVGTGTYLWSRLLSGEDQSGVFAIAVSPEQETLTANISEAPNPDFGTGPLGASPGATSRLVIAKLGK